MDRPPCGVALPAAVRPLLQLGGYRPVQPGLVGLLYRSYKRNGGEIMTGYRFSEMMRLVQEQTEALEKQTFGGFTDEEMAEFEERQERIRELQSGELNRAA